MHQDRRLRIFLLQLAQSAGLELLVYHAAAIPDEHVSAGLALDIVAQVFIRRPQYFLSLLVQVLNKFRGDTRRYHPVGTRFHGCAGIGVHHHLAFRMGIAKWNERVGRAPEIERALGLQGRHEHTLFRIQNLGGLAHETHTGDHQCSRRMLMPKTRHVE